MMGTLRSWGGPVHPFLSNLNENRLEQNVSVDPTQLEVQLSSYTIDWTVAARSVRSHANSCVAIMDSARIK